MFLIMKQRQKDYRHILIMTNVLCSDSISIAGIAKSLGDAGFERMNHFWRRDADATVVQINGGDDKTIDEKQTENILLDGFEENGLSYPWDKVIIHQGLLDTNIKLNDKVTLQIFYRAMDKVLSRLGKQPETVFYSRLSGFDEEIFFNLTGYIGRRIENVEAVIDLINDAQGGLGDVF